MLIAFLFVQERPNSYVMIFYMTLGPEPPSMRQQWDILSKIFTKI